MYTKIRIENFRGFRDLTVEPLRRVNLLVAKSNTGKTAFLEAVALLVNGKGVVESFPKAFRNSSHPEVGLEFWSWLFHGRNLSSVATIEASGGEREPLQAVRLRCTADGGHTRPDGYVSVRQFNAEKKQYVVWMRTEPEMNKRGDTLRELNETNGGAKVFATSAMDAVEEARKYHKVMIKRGGEEKVESLLKVIEPRLVKIRPAQIGQQPSIYADIGLSELIPVSQLGQGFSRVLSIYTAVLLSEAKVFLVDEIENGIHYSALEQVWQGLAEMAEREDVQVFATTHSWECLVAASKVFAKHEPYDFAVHRLELSGDNVVAKTYDRETLATSIEQGFEVR